MSGKDDLAMISRNTGASLVVLQNMAYSTDTALELCGNKDWVAVDKIPDNKQSQYAQCCKELKRAAAILRTCLASHQRIINVHQRRAKTLFTVVSDFPPLPRKFWKFVKELVANNRLDVQPHRK